MSKHQIPFFQHNPVIFNELQKYLPKIINNINLYNYAISEKEEKKLLRIPINFSMFYKSNYEEYYKMGLATIHEKNIFDNYDEFEILL